MPRSKLVGHNCSIPPAGRQTVPILSENNSIATKNICTIPHTFLKGTSAGLFYKILLLDLSSLLKIFPNFSYSDVMLGSGLEAHRNPSPFNHYIFADNWPLISCLFLLSWFPSFLISPLFLPTDVSTLFVSPIFAHPHRSFRSGSTSRALPKARERGRVSSPLPEARGKAKGRARARAPMSLPRVDRD